MKILLHNFVRNASSILKPSKAIRLLLMVLFVCLFGNVSSAATITSKALTGNWDAATSWVGGSVPAVDDYVIIVSGAFISLTANINQAGVVTINAGGTLSDGGKSLTIDNKLNPGMIVFGTFKVTAPNGLNKGNGQGGNTTVVVNSGGMIWLSTTDATVGVNNWINNPGSIVKLDAGGDQTIDNSFVGAQLDNLILGGFGAKKLVENITISQVLSMQGTATLDLNKKVLTYASGSVLEYSGWTGITGSEWPTTFSTATGGLQVINNSTVTLKENKTLSLIPLTIKGGSTLANGGFTLNAPTSLTLECGATGSTLSGAGLLTLGGNITVNKIAGTGAGATISCPVALGATRTFSVADETTSVSDLTLSGIVSTAFGIIKDGIGTLTLSRANTYTGVTTVTAGTLELDSADRIANTSSITFNGGKLSTGATTGFNETVGALTLSSDSSIDLGTGSHTLTFANSNVAIWGAFTLTINGWTGTSGVSGGGTAGKIQIGTGGLNEGQLAKVLFTGYPLGAVITASGELVPPPTALPTTSVGTYTFCIDNTNTQNTASTKSGQFATINIIKGFTYSFSVGNVFTANNEILTLLDMSNNRLAPPIYNGGTNGTVITNWVATYSGQVKLVLSSGNGVNGLAGGVINIQLIALGNTQDSQTTFGTNTWVGHIYNSSGASPEPFVSANYAGYYTSPSETIVEGFGGDTVCLNVLSNGTARAQMYTETFAVRYRMKTTKTGCYLVNFRGDDGIRLTLNGQIVFSSWIEQSPVNFSNILIQLDGDDDLVLEYYENGGQNEVGFSLISFDARSNTITVPATINFCSNGDPAILEGSLQYSSSNPALQNPQLNFQWQLATDGGAFSNISGATTRTYDPPAIINGTAVNIVRRFKRVVTFNLANIPDINGVRTNCVYNESNIVTITTSPSAPTQPGTITGIAAQCPAVLSQIYSVTVVPNATTYTWTVPTGWTITAGLGTNSITVTTGATGQNGDIAVTASNVCAGTSAAKKLAVTVLANMTVIGATSRTLCINTALSPNLTHSTTLATGISNSGVSGANGLPAGVSAVWATNTITISGTPTVAGIFNYVIPLTGGCGNINATGTITISASNTADIPSSSPTLCTNTALTNITVATTGGTGISNSGVSGANGLPVGVSAVWATNTITISGTPAASGTFNYSIPLTGGCASVNATGTIIVSPNLPASVSISASANSVCTGTSVTFTTSPTNGGTIPAYQWKINGNNVSGQTAATFTTTTLANGNIVTCVLTSNAKCGIGSPATSNGITMLVNSVPTTPTLGTKTQPNCKTPTGSITLSDLKATETLSQTGTFPATYTITGSTMTISELAAGTYNFTVTNAFGCISPATDNVVIDPFSEVTNTWNGSAWSKLTPPTVDQNIEFAGNYDLTSDLTACSCQVNAGVNVDIESGKTLKLTNELIVNGRILFKDKSSLVQINNVANKGNIEYERNIYSSNVLQSDYIYWSSPVAGFKLGDVYKKNTTGLFYSYGVTAEIEDWIQESSENTMTAGKGYIINGITYKFPLPPPSSPNFKGVPNNGDIIVPVKITPAVDGTSALLGNPYPSAIDADKFLTANSAVLDGTLYFWTHNTERGIGVSNPGTGVFAYSSDDYASYNFTGGVGTSPDIRIAIGNLPGGVVANEIKANQPSGKIASGQGFFATSIKAGDVTFTNDMRVAGSTKLDGTGVNQQFFRTKDLKGKTANTFEKNRVWLNLTNTQGAFKQTLIGYITDATNEYDSRFDGESFDANEYVDFYSVYEDRNLVIQGRALPFDAADEVPLGYRTAIDGNFTINIDQVDGSMTNQAVFIEDKLTNTVFNLKTGNYTFSTAPGTFNDRFVLKYRDASKTLTVDTIEKEDGILAFYSNNYNTLIIHNDNFDETVNSVALFNMAGQKIGVWDVSNSEQTNIQVPIKNISSGIYIVKVTTTKGESSKKIIVN
jgi:autotransporter-associated beta strand protein